MPRFLCGRRKVLNWTKSFDKKVFVCNDKIRRSTIAYINQQWKALKTCSVKGLIPGNS